ncbi:DUF397 domain-containing protein [Nocardiopsis sp. CT-R113]|uniref:DUF397 domain-containing protein n=1 Tax=Nocardiopsis codii TaxID=3065942 RepID=A0ABU7KC87_9ACTN|nr:DUF397 domain-containing protein [Nocardiopsis sp. CT-R113]MEE2039539.1 DUF397 domain-containing protein [Nocardiopsis sp. CT-R113]
MMGQTWQKSSYSNGDGGNCVEARVHVMGGSWMTSSHGTGGTRAEARTDTAASRVHLRDTQNRELGHLSVPVREWDALRLTLSGQ